jgi:hypothetical protein
VAVLPAAISAVAATIAAVLAGINIYLNRHSENVKWARVTLVETFTEFLNASFEVTSAVKEAARIGREDPGAPEIASLRAEAFVAEARMRNLQTRLRLLTNVELIGAAQSLRLAIRTYIASLDEPVVIPAESDKALRVEVWRRREAFIAAVKKVLSL